MSLRHLGLKCLIPLLWLIACDRKQPVAPVLEAGVSGVGGPAVKAPSNTNASTVSESRIDVSWQDNSTGETGFEVWRSPSGLDGTFTKLAGTGANVASYGDAGLTASTKYCYRIRAFRNYDGKTSYSDLSNTACVTTLAPGAIKITTATTGSYLDPDGYSVRMDGGPDQPIGTNAAVTIAGVSVGEHTLSLSGVEWNCSVNGANPRTVSVAGGATTETVFAVSCGPGYSLVVTTVTTGVDVDANGYHVGAAKTCWGTPDCRICPTCGDADLAVNGTATISGLQSGDYLVELSGVASNCSLIASPPSIVAVPGAVEFDVACAPIPPGTEVCENGLDDDGDGLIDSDDPDCQLFCPYGDCFADACGPGYICGYDGCCTPHCNDGVVDGSESDVDCGGYCLPCAAGKYCGSNFDCASGVCVNNICQ